MRITSPSLFGLAFAAVAGSTYVATGHRDFTVEVHQPLPRVYAAFGDLKRYSAELRSEGLNVPPITLTRPSDHELIFTAPSANPGQISRIAFNFEAAPGSTTTRVSAAIDVPPITMGVDGKDMYLAEDKVEARFREAIAKVGHELDQGNVQPASRAELGKWLALVALASNPKEFARYNDRVAHVRSEMDQLKANLERDGYEVRDGAEPGTLEWRHRDPDGPATSG